MNGFRTSAIRADFSNKAEYNELPGWMQWLVAFASVVFFIVSSVFWFDVMHSVYKTNSNYVVFVFVLLGYMFTLGFPILIYTFGYIHAKNVEYNRSIDSVHLVGSIGGQLAMNNSGLHRGFMETFELGRQFQMEMAQQVQELATNMDELKDNNVDLIE